MIRLLLDLIFPSVCAACGTPADDAICAGCRARLVRPRSCARCALPLAARACEPCRRDPPPFVAARAVALYEGAARDALMTYKLGGERRAAPGLAAMMAPLVRALSPEVITFVPATRRATAARGFDPALELARHLGRATGIPARPLLRKVRQTVDQAGLNAAQRRRNQRGAYRAPRAIDAGRVALVDDILTTGATAAACTEALLAAGAREVVIVVFARAPAPGAGAHRAPSLARARPTP